MKTSKNNPKIGRISKKSTHTIYFTANVISVTYSQTPALKVILLYEIIMNGAAPRAHIKNKKDKKKKKIFFAFIFTRAP